MPLNKVTLKQSIKAAFQKAKEQTGDPDAAFDELAGSISDAVDTYVKGMTITYLTGLTSPSGPVAGVFTNEIS
jgi:hypothetical protein